MTKKKNSEPENLPLVPREVSGPIIDHGMEQELGPSIWDSSIRPTRAYIVDLYTRLERAQAFDWFNTAVRDRVVDSLRSMIEASEKAIAGPGDKALDSVLTRRVEEEELSKRQRTLFPRDSMSIGHIVSIDGDLKALAGEEYDTESIKSLLKDSSVEVTLPDLSPDQVSMLTGRFENAQETSDSSDALHDETQSAGRTEAREGMDAELTRIRLAKLDTFDIRRVLPKVITSDDTGPIRVKVVKKSSSGQTIAIGTVVSAEPEKGELVIDIPEPVAALLGLGGVTTAHAGLFGLSIEEALDDVEKEQVKRRLNRTRPAPTSESYPIPADADEATKASIAAWNESSVPDAALPRVRVATPKLDGLMQIGEDGYFTDRKGFDVYLAELDSLPADLREHVRFRVSVKPNYFGNGSFHVRADIVSSLKLWEYLK